MSNYNPVEMAYRILCEVHHKTANISVEEYGCAVEEAIGFLGEALAEESDK